MIYVPWDCPRGREDCRALSNIISDNGESFFCCGENNGKNRAIEQDKYTTCFKGQFRDEIANSDKRDLIHQSSVIIQALAVIEPAFGDDEYSAWEEG